MSIVKTADFVRQVTDGAAEGTASLFTLASTPTGFQSFIGAKAQDGTLIAGGDTVAYSVQDGASFETWLGVVTDAVNDTLSRVTLLSSSNKDVGGNPIAVDWGAGAKTVSSAPLSGLGALAIAGIPVDNAAQADKRVLFFNGAATKVEYGDPDTLSDALIAPAGTRLLFPQATAPTGWTQDASLNDRVLRVVSGAGGGTGGNWAISGVTVQGHALTQAELPSYDLSYTDGGHYHTRGDDPSVPNIVLQSPGSGTAGSWTTSGGSAFRTTTDPVNITIHSGGGNQAHNHDLTADGNWRPAYVDSIIASKD
jgi:hypothetical protein